MAMAKTVFFILLALVANAQAAPCTGFCANDATCDDTGACDCSTAPHTSGVFCQNCFPNFSPLSNCMDVINPCITCTNSSTDSCADTPNICPLYGTCLNIDAGKYTCKCSKGFSGVVTNATYPNGVCVDIDECKLKKRACPVWSTCTNTNGWYNCKCVKGRKPLYDSTGSKLRFCIVDKKKGGN